MPPYSDFRPWCIWKGIRIFTWWKVTGSLLHHSCICGYAPREKWKRSKIKDEARHSSGWWLQCFVMLDHIKKCMKWKNWCNRWAYFWSGWERATPTSSLSQISSFEVSQLNRKENLSERCHVFFIDMSSHQLTGCFISHEIRILPCCEASSSIGKILSDRKNPSDPCFSHWISRDSLADLSRHHDRFDVLVWSLKSNGKRWKNLNLRRFGWCFVHGGPRLTMVTNGGLFTRILTNYQWPKINGYTPEI